MVVEIPHITAGSLKLVEEGLLFFCVLVGVQLPPLLDKYTEEFLTKNRDVISIRSRFSKQIPRATESFHLHR